MAEEIFNDETSPLEWSNYLPDAHHNLCVKTNKPVSFKEQIPAKATDHDLTMEFLTKEQKKNKIRNIAINDFEKVDKYVVYKIEVHIQECSWVVSRRYREFHRLHEELVQLCGLAWELLPPKKIVGNLNPSHIEKRKKLLEKYLKTVLHTLVDIPIPLVEFLEIDQFDVNTVCNQLAGDLFEIGDELLAKKLTFKITPLQIHCINRRLLLPLPTCEGSNPKADIGHLYSFIQQVPKILVYPGDENHMFIGQNNLNYDLSIFKSLQYLEVQKCDIELMEGIESIQKNMIELRAHKCLQLLKDFLIGSDSWTQGVLMTVSSGKEAHSDVVSQFQTWDKIQKASFSHNDIHSVDYSITLLTNITTLDLSHNLLTEVQYLEELIFLTDLNLSYNEIRHLAEFPYRVPSVSKLNLAGNGIQNIAGLEKMYALEHLDLSNNSLYEVPDVLILGNLPLLTALHVKGNPLTDVHNHRVRILAQFGGRAKEVSLDGYAANKRETSKITDMLTSQDNFDVISDDLVAPSSPLINEPASPYKFSSPVVNDPSSSQKLSSSVTSATRSPRTKKKDRIAQINPPSASAANTENLSKLEREEENFREQIEKLRDHAGDSWLTFYNEMVDEKAGNADSSDKLEDEQCKTPEVESVTTCKELEESKPIKCSDELDKKISEETDAPSREKPPYIRFLSIDEIDLELSDELRAGVKKVIQDGSDLNNETFLIQEKNNEGEVQERMVAVDVEKKALMEIDFNTGATLLNYQLESIRGLTVDEEQQCYILQFEAKRLTTSTENESYVLVKLRTNSVKDAAGLYVLLKSYNGKKQARSRSHIFTSMSGLIENPFNTPNEILIAFFQDFIRKTALLKRNSQSRDAQRDTTSNYENIDVGVSLLKHVVADSSSQDVVSMLWVGCLPYLFPDEEIPVCVVMTTLNVFLFRVFFPEKGKGLETMEELQEAMHCFYSFPLKQIREIVVGLFDQGLRVEVAEEGPRGTFVFLTRDASKTAQFLDALSSVLGFRNEKDLVQTKTRLSNSDELPCVDLPTVVYPDENKINALKIQLQEQELSPLDNRENLISYCIVYEYRDDVNYECYDESSMPYLRSLILTNVRLILCEEDYVHWPLPSYVRSAPFTPQWLVDDVEAVDAIIGVDLWENKDGKQCMTGCYGVSITFESKETASDACKVEGENVWNLLFQSISEREQFVRSIACLWKNNFDRDLKITYSKSGLTSKSIAAASVKGHVKKNSGNISIPSTQTLDSPDMFVNLDRSRLNELFRNKISQDEDANVTGVQFVTCVGCKPYKYPDVEFNVALILGRFNIYIVCSSQNRKYILANNRFEDEGGTSSLYTTVVKISTLQQVVVGLFDQCFRLEAGTPDHTFVFVTRNFDRTNEFVQRLSQVILALPKEMNVVDSNGTTNRRRTAAEIFQLYKRDEESDPNYYPKSEFIHPNSNIKFVYPSDETLEKLRYKILDHIRIMELFQVDEDFSVLLYALIFQHVNEQAVPYTVVVSEKFLCMINEDRVNYPLPSFVNELPETTQYEVVGMELISALLRIEFDEFHSGAFSLVFNKEAVDPTSYEARFHTSSVEEDVCLVTDVNTTKDQYEEEHLETWILEAHSYVERDKIFNVLSKMWANFYAGMTLPVLRKKTKL